MPGIEPVRPDIKVDLKSSAVTVDGEIATSEPLQEVPLNRLYMLA